jgi:uncharacterized membrane protein YfcA
VPLEEFLLYAAIGFGAQLIDGALGMGFGVIASAVMISTGVPPAISSASVHAAKSFTTAAAGSSNIYYKNVAWKLFGRLALAGVIGGVIGAVLISHSVGSWVKAIVAAYLAVMGMLIIYRGITGSHLSTQSRHVFRTGLAGGFLDAVGGGGWGPITVTTLLSRGGQPRFIIGSVNLAEFFVSIAVVTAFFLVSVLNESSEVSNLSIESLTKNGVIPGLVSGAIIAAPFAGWLVRISPARPLQVAVGLLVIGLSAYTIWQTFR